MKEERDHPKITVGYQVFDGEVLVHTGEYRNAYTQERRAFNERLEDALSKGLVVIMGKKEIENAAGVSP